MLNYLFEDGDVEEINNNKLSRIFSVEIVGSLLVTAFMVGVTWSALSKDVGATDVKVAGVEKKHIELEGNVQSIQVDVAIVKTNQEHIKRDFDRQRQELREQAEDIKSILQILQQEHNHGGD